MSGGGGGGGSGGFGFSALMSQEILAANAQDQKTN